MANCYAVVMNSKGKLHDKYEVVDFIDEGFDTIKQPCGKEVYLGGGLDAFIFKIVGESANSMKAMFPKKTYNGVGELTQEGIKYELDFDDKVSSENINAIRNSVSEDFLMVNVGISDINEKA